jgi:hypothetical protein
VQIGAVMMMMEEEEEDDGVTKTKIMHKVLPRPN